MYATWKSSGASRDGGTYRKFQCRNGRLEGAECDREGQVGRLEGRESGDSSWRLQPAIGKPVRVFDQSDWTMVPRKHPRINPVFESVLLIEYSSQNAGESRPRKDRVVVEIVEGRQDPVHSFHDAILQDQQRVALGQVVVTRG